MAHEEENHPEEENAGSQSISEGVAAARAEIARRAEIRSGVTKPVAKKSENGIPGGQTLKMFLLKLVFGLVLIVLIGYFFLQALAGTINVGINSTNTDLNGKEAVFETTLNYIKESVTPKLTDDWVKENLGESMSLNNVDELKAFVKSTMLYDNQASDVYTDLHRATLMWLLLGVWIWVPHCI